MALLTFDVSLDKIMTDPNNARKHDRKNLDAIKASLAKFGQQKPIVVDEKNIVLAGNGTLDAARSLGWETITVVRTSLTGFDAMAYALADNRTSELAEWDQPVLDTQLAALQDFDFDLADMGFDLPPMENENAGNGEEDEIPEVEDNPYGVKRGDIWLLGTYLQCDKCEVKAEYQADKVDQVCGACHA